LLEKPTSGQIVINGQDQVALNPSQLREARRNIGMIFQQFNLLSSKTVWENIALPLQIIHTPKTEINARVNELLDLVGLKDRARHRPAQLSGGQKQRAAIARALATKPQILLCDEATSALDPNSTQSILQLLQTINQQLGITIVLITHEVEVVKNCCQRVALIENGHILQVKPVTEFFAQLIDPAHPSHEAVVSYIGGHEWDERLLSICKHEEMSGLLLRIRFHGHSAAKPLMAHLVKTYELEINILQANLEFVGNDLVGTMIVQIENHPHIDAGLSFLRSKGVIIEELAHVI
ncbi:MAG: ATP-binding cassette domain-containing protein, partial [Gammaproteobacteria bacterium]|nr:ATP-binding cassette domain-containing protein [Gammaproteobacteria bacterium]